MVLTLIIIFSLSPSLSPPAASDAVGARFATEMAYAWSSMIAHWMSTGVESEAIIAASETARNLDPTNPVPWTAIATAGKGETSLDVLNELNALQHAIELDSSNLSKYAVLALAKLVFLRDPDDSTNSGHELLSTLQRRVMIHLIRYVERHGGEGMLMVFVALVSVC